MQNSNYVITIARGYGSGGKTMGKMLSERLGINYYDRQLIRLASDDSGVHERLFGRVDERVNLSKLFRSDVSHYDGNIIHPEHSDYLSEKNLFSLQAKVIKQLAEKESCIIVGRCADYILAGHPNLIRVFIYAGEEFCTEKVMELFGRSRKEAAQDIRKFDQYRSEYYRYYTGNDWDNARNYDLCLNSERLGFDGCAEAIISYMKLRLG